MHTTYTWRRKWQPTPIILPGEVHGQRSLAGYIPWGCKESGMTNYHSLHILFFFFLILFYILTLQYCIGFAIKICFFLLNIDLLSASGITYLPLWLLICFAVLTTV